MARETKDEVIHLTPAQKDAFPTYLDRWEGWGLSTSPASRAAAEEGIQQAYIRAGVRKTTDPPIPVYWLGSPLAGAVVDTVISRLANPEERERSSETYDSKILAVVDSVIPLLHSLLPEHRKKLTKSYILSCLPHLQIHNACYGQHDASILCFYDFFLNEVGVEDCRVLDGLIQVAQNAGWWWAYDTCAIATERPTHLNLDSEHRLHSTETWAVRYPNGFEYCFDHGVQIPDYLIFDPSQNTVERIEAETNAEVRRVMIEKYGQAEYLLDSGAKEIHRDDFGTLYRKEIPNDEALVMVKVVNSTPEPDGSFRNYFIRVHPELRPIAAGKPPGEPQEPTARNAVASTFYKRGEEYSPEEES